MMKKYAFVQTKKKRHPLACLILFFSVVFLQACDSYETTVTYDGSKVTPTRPPTYTPSQNWWLGSVFGQKSVDPAEICKESTVQAVKHSQNFFWDLVISGVTSGIYMPYTTEIWCTPKPTTSVEKNTPPSEQTPATEDTTEKKEEAPKVINSSPESPKDSAK